MYREKYLETKIRDRLKSILRKMENIYTKAGVDKRKLGGVRIDMIMNRCLNHIEELNSLKNVPSEIKRTALEYGWRIYMDLQEFNAPVERQDIASTDREIPLDEVLKQIENLERTPVTISHGMFSGGTGYRSVNWDAEYWMATTKGNQVENEYWNEEEAKKKRPVKVYTKEELKKFQ